MVMYWLCALPIYTPIHGDALLVLYEWNPLDFCQLKTHNENFRGFICREAGQSVEQMVELTVILDGMALMWRDYEHGVKVHQDIQYVKYCVRKGNGRVPLDLTWLAGIRTWISNYMIFLCNYSFAPEVRHGWLHPYYLIWMLLFMHTLILMLD